VISKRTGYILVAVACTMFSCNGIVGRIAIDGGVAPSQVSAIRICGAALLLLPFVIRAARRFRRPMLVPMTLYAVVGLVAAQGLFFEAVAELDVAIVLVIVYLAPLLVAVYERVREGEQLPLYAYIAMVVALGGVALCVLGGIGHISAWGIALTIVAMFVFAGQLLLASRQPVELDPLARAGGTLLIGAIVWQLIVPVWSLPFDQLGQVVELDGRAALSVPIGAALLWIVILGATIPYVMLLWGAIRIGAGATSMLEMTQPVVGATIAWLVLGQQLSALQVTGIVVTVVAIGVVEQARMRLGHTDDLEVVEL